ncbi:hypothetical protein H257_05189 [Aphanomyces astaci]|uniref:Uncharacterized protein n=1 Tax=Aphanomyces astaci TaxID=112090 RepID=W4GSE8_APHAT|nr:hypothetical protein H257_05189 [Aphanomyces astaci]ETV82612.1 hypothetical protein H257_05189 [Aphanomyces astaci]|eukprot:XP_009828281.1 hypothetical protein H257_05189 [Aphanomyces astaci]
MSPHEPGSASDLTMVRSRLDQHNQALAKDDYDDTINDNGKLFRELPTSWAVLVHKGYIGLAVSAHTIHPKKKPRFTFALTNFHATLMPLRLEDNDHYRAIMARYKSMAAENTSKTAANQRRYLQRRAERFAPEAARASRTSRGTFLSPMVSGRR